MLDSSLPVATALADQVATLDASGLPTTLNRDQNRLHSSKTPFISSYIPQWAGPLCSRQQGQGRLGLRTCGSSRAFLGTLDQATGMDRA